MKVYGLPKEAPSLIEASRLCSYRVFSPIGSRRSPLLKWVQPGVAAVYKGNDHDSLVERRVGTIVMRASVNRGQFRNMPPELTGTWLRHIYLCDEEGMGRVSMYLPMKSMKIIRPDVLILFLHMCSNTTLAPLVNVATSYVGQANNYMVTQDSTTNGTGTAFMFNQDVTTPTTNIPATSVAAHLRQSMALEASPMQETCIWTGLSRSITVTTWYSPSTESPLSISARNV